MSSETNLFGTGLDIGDIDGDGWLDLAVSNGNDMALAPNLVYISADGTLPTAASWASQDARYSGHCQLADLDGDGLPELMVANYITAANGMQAMVDQAAQDAQASGALASGDAPLKPGQSVQKYTRLGKTNPPPGRLG